MTWGPSNRGEEQGLGRRREVNESEIGQVRNRTSPKIGHGMKNRPSRKKKKPYESMPSKLAESRGSVKIREISKGL